MCPADRGRPRECAASSVRPHPSAPRRSSARQPLWTPSPEPAHVAVTTSPTVAASVDGNKARNPDPHDRSPFELRKSYNYGLVIGTPNAQLTNSQTGYRPGWKSGVGDREFTSVRSRQRAVAHNGVHDRVFEIQADLLIRRLSHQDADDSLLRIDEKVRAIGAAPAERSGRHE